MQTENPTETDFIPPTIEIEDIQQEAALLKLLGKTPNMGILYKQAARYEAVLTSFDSDFTCDQMPWSDTPDPSEAIATLVDYALAQSEAIAAVIFEFLDSRDVEVALAKLHLQQRSDPKSNSFTSRILEALRQPQTLDQLYELARSMHFAKRPEATVRQILRRLISQGRILREHDVYRLP